MEQFNPMQQIKHRLYAMRNGAIADSMRRMGMPYRIIFGVNLPQLSAIAAETPKSVELATQLWENRSTRESMLLAPMLFPKDKMDMATATKWASETPTAEVADILCMKLLRDLEFAPLLADRLILADDDMTRYTALRLMFNLLPARLHEVKAYATAELTRNVPITRAISTALLDEISFLEDGDNL